MIIIVGAGMGGLACATRLEQAGADWLLLEASGKPGGRVATEVTPEGFRLDRGFQVLLDSYRTARYLFDFEALRPRYFQSGALLASPGGTESLLNPIAHPSGFFGIFSSRAFSFREKASLALFGVDQMARAVCSSKETGRTSLEEFRRHGLGGELLERFLRPFFAGVFLDNNLATDSSVLAVDIRHFALGKALVPENGMGEIPCQLASRLPCERQCYDSPVRSLERRGEEVVAVHLASGERISCDALVLATEEPVTRLLTELPQGRAWNRATTLYFTGNEPLCEGACLVLPAGRNRLVRHFADMTNVVPSYAPTDRRLLTATLLDDHGLRGTERIRAAQSEISSLMPSFASWEFLAEVEIPLALPSQAPGFTALRPSAHPERNLWLVGDQVARASIDSALASGLNSADEVLSFLR